MRHAILFLIAGLLHAQDGQQGSRPGWPCVAGRAVDPAYIETSESTGGQLFLFQKNEIAQSGPAMSASYTHPATVLRALGNLSGSRDFEFPVDSGIESMLFLVSLQCRNAIRVTRPNGTEMTAANSAQSVDLQAGRILRIDHPETGLWHMRLTGTGLFVASVLAKTNISLAMAAYLPNGDVQARIAGHATNVKLQIVDAAGDPIPGAEATELTPEGLYRTHVNPQTARFRILVTGTDDAALPFQRIHPNLLRAHPK